MLNKMANKSLDTFTKEELDTINKNPQLARALARLHNVDYMI